MSNVRALNKEKYKIGEFRFRELFYFCLQYDEWKDELQELQEVLKGVQYSEMPSSGNPGDPTSNIAIKCAEYSRKCDLIEQAAKIADPELHEYILFYVTQKNATFQYMKTRKNIPCERDRFYDRRRKFYFVLDQLLKQEDNKCN